MSTGWPLRYLPDRNPKASGLHTSTPMPYRWVTGSTEASIPRARMEYGGCSVRKRPRPRRSATWWDSTMSSAGNVEHPNVRIFPARCRSVRADSVSSMSVVRSGRWTW